MKILLSLIVIASIFSACSKTIDSSDSAKDYQSSNDVSGISYAECKLRRIVHEDLAGEGRIANGLFTYYQNGNPFSLTYPDGSQNSDFFFYYDKKLRLQEVYTNSFFIPIKNRYGYNSQNQIVVDTLFNTTNWSEDGYIFYPRIISVLTYDFQGRIIKEVRTEIDGSGTATYNYKYDSRGNLEVGGNNNYAYDNKVSIFRSHPVFQFYNRNYSMNNPIQAKYNSKGLPLAVSPSNDNFFEAYRSNPGVGWKGGIIKAIYDCE